MFSFPTLSVALALTAPSAIAQRHPATPAAAHQIGARRIASGLEHPVLLCAPHGDLHRQFVIELAGRVRVIQDDVLLMTPFLDITPEVGATGEGGLLGMDFHPDYATN